MKSYIYGDLGNEIDGFDSRACIFVDHYDIEKKQFKNADYKVFVQIEPPEIHDPEKLYKIADKFDLILTWSKDTLAKFPNAKFFGWGSTWIPQDQQKIHNKSKVLSIIASEKRFLPGHKLRHEVIEKFGDKMDLFGRGYKYIEYKTEALNDYMFTIVIENVDYPNYYTEKIVDCIRTGTVPIYWGCSNINEFYDINGFIRFEKAEDLEKIIPTLNEDLYKKMLPYVQKNFEKSEFDASNYMKRLHDEIGEHMKEAQIKIPSFFQKILW